MKTTHLPASTFKTTVWSGGKTTELFIFPPTANYAQRDFDFRLSTATVEVETSAFTSLPGYSRKLMVLDGATKLMHENQHEILINPFEVDTFLGDWKTTSAGKCTDFNVMTRGNFSSEISVLQLKKNKTQQIFSTKNANWLLLYFFKGEANLSIENKLFCPKQGDVFVLENGSESQISAQSLKDCVIICTEIWL